MFTSSDHTPAQRLSPLPIDFLLPDVAAAAATAAATRGQHLDTVPSMVSLASLPEFDDYGLGTAIYPDTTIKKTTSATAAAATTTTAMTVDSIDLTDYEAPFDIVNFITQANNVASVSSSASSKVSLAPAGTTTTKKGVDNSRVYRVKRKEKFKAMLKRSEGLAVENKHAKTAIATATRDISELKLQILHLLKLERARR